MQVIVREVTIEPAPNGKKYQVANVVFDQGGQNKKTRVMSFAAPQVFDTLKNLPRNSLVNVETTQNGQYQNWSHVSIADSTGTDTTSAAPAAKAYTGGKVTGSNYETAAERAKKQVYIVRQSSISAAVAALATGAKTPPSAEAILTLAKQFEEFVFDDGQLDAETEQAGTE